ncbi:hypothetical protein GALMADRAFT_1247342 [Galerina marginata CBS 339.88]|uniref:Uncharacterized protein n=1 Tax=Galerina marginata (strain CBS 339.88) TaxID=685588 RepID=A0A067T950_GALM3|nr:hypothetical protein GALMADRAFT_1247342 [Galerina marginata CBS 339.88]
MVYSESAPLLEDPERHAELEEQPNAESNAPSDSDGERTPTPTYFKILSTITLGLSAVTLGLLIVNHIIIRYAPFTGYYWNTLEATVALGQWVRVFLS